VSISGRRLILAVVEDRRRTLMTRFRFSPALLLVLASLAGAAYAADPEFKGIPTAAS